MAANKPGLSELAANKPDLSDLAERWPSAFVAREKSSEFSGGIIGPKYLANLDSKGLGPPGRVRVGRKICYPVGPFIEWLEKRAVRI